MVNSGGVGGGGGGGEGGEIAEMEEGKAAVESMFDWANAYSKELLRTLYVSAHGARDAMAKVRPLPLLFLSLSLSFFLSPLPPFLSLSVVSFRSLCACRAVPCPPSR